jgi:OmpR family response regulator RpaB
MPVKKNIGKVLVIEDESALLKVITDKFSKVGITTITATNSNQAIECLQDLHKANDYPDAIWLDYYLKDSDGLTFMKEFHDLKDIPNIPILVVSNSASEKKVKGLLALGAKKYLLKAEHRLEDIVSEVKTLINSNKI